MKAKQSLGQNFLISHQVVADIIATAEITPTENILEVGPGRGILTEALLASGANVIAVEKDERLIPELEQRFAKEVAGGNLVLVHDDILKLAPSNWQLAASKLDARRYKLVANIPYYITGELLQKFLTAEHQPVSMTLMLQKEVAERIVAKDGKESILSISVKAYGEPEYMRTVKRVCFRPIPNVDSAVLAIKKISRDFFKIHDLRFTIYEWENKFFALVKKGFAHKRKKLSNNLPELSSLGASGAKWSGVGNKRAEELSLADWAELARDLQI